MISIQTDSVYLPRIFPCLVTDCYLTDSSYILAHLSLVKIRGFITSVTFNLVSWIFFLVRSVWRRKPSGEAANQDTGHTAKPYLIPINLMVAKFYAAYVSAVIHFAVCTPFLAISVSELGVFNNIWSGNSWFLIRNLIMIWKGNRIWISQSYC